MTSASSRLGYEILGMRPSTNHIDYGMPNIDDHSTRGIRFEKPQRVDRAIRIARDCDYLSVKHCDIIPLMEPLALPHEVAVDQLGDTQVAVLLVHGDPPGATVGGKIDEHRIPMRFYLPNSADGRPNPSRIKRTSIQT
jgi:hypothetical protein